MKIAVSRTIALAAAVLTLASGNALAQGKGQVKQKDKDKHDAVPQVDTRAQTGARRDVPAGLAKKPGQMPPGKYKKVYPTQGASVLRDILVLRGYTVVRTTPSGESQYVYYRLPDGTVQRAIVAPGTDRLSFTNVPAALLQ
jgi:hypothetical protein